MAIAESLNAKKFFGELKRRNVYKVAVAYAVISWLVMQVTATVVPALHLPDAITTAVVGLSLLGFPIALVIAWAFEMTPEGMKRTENVSPNEHIPQWSRRKFAAFIASVAIVAASFLGFQLWRTKSKPIPGSVSLPMAGAPTALPAAIPEKSIAVLPFDNLSEDPENAYFSEGIQEEILTRLAKIADLKVVSRPAAGPNRSYRGSVREIARELGAANILEGSVQKAGEQVRVNVQLINAATESHLWAETYDRELTDIFAVESEIARTVAEMLQAKLTGVAEHVLASRPTQNPNAHELYLKGRFFWNQRDPANLQKAIGFFQKAINLDSTYALAYAGLADSYAPRADLFPHHAKGRYSEGCRGCSARIGT